MRLDLKVGQKVIMYLYKSDNEEMLGEHIYVRIS